jgi:uncharacterized protein YpmS
MLFSVNHNNNHRLNYCSWKRIFLTLLFLNTFLGCIYFIHEEKEQEINQNIISTSTTWKKIFTPQQQNQSFIETTNAIKFIQNILEREYNQDDLIKFYNYVQKEYSLGLKCTRKKNILTGMNISNRTNRIRSNTEIINNTIR